MSKIVNNLNKSIQSSTNKKIVKLCEIFENGEIIKFIEKIPRILFQNFQDDKDDTFKIILDYVDSDIKGNATTSS